MTWQFLVPDPLAHAPTQRNAGVQEDEQRAHRRSTHPGGLQPVRRQRVVSKRRVQRALFSLGAVKKPCR